MVQLWIDDTLVEVEEGQTILDAARKLRIDIPAMCKHANHPPNNSCMCCLVKVDGRPGPVPSCATPAREGMRVESETESIHALRRTGIELLLGDHAGDCHAPCENTCPARMDIPDMLRFVAEGDYRAAIETVKRDIALPAILGRVCPEVCESACRRGQHDSPAAICKIKQFVADHDASSPEPYVPVTAESSGKSVVVLGAGPTGMTAAYHLIQRGHAVTVMDDREKFGGRLHDDFLPSVLPREVLQREANLVLAGARQTRQLCAVDDEASFDDLVDQYDAVLVCTGREQPAWFEAVGIKTTKSGVVVDSTTRMTSRTGVFAAGNAVRTYKLVVQSVAEGKLAAQCIDHWLRGIPIPERRHHYETRLARLTSGELCDFCAGYPETPRIDNQLPGDQLTEELAQLEAHRCLECDCSALDTCKLHHYAALYHCDAQRFRGSGRRYEGRIHGEHVVLESGKCILCGICVQITEKAPDAGGLAFLGRSMESRIGPVLGMSLDEAFGSVARECAEACPTGAIVLVTPSL